MRSRTANISLLLILMIAARPEAVGIGTSDAQEQKAAPTPANQDEMIRHPAPASAIGDAAMPFPPALIASAERNAALRFDMEWTFGGKAQRGWNLYVHLVRELIGAEDEPEAPGFALALSLWQRDHGLSSTGVLDRDTWYRVVTAFQARRIRDRSVPRERHLTEIEERDLYDPERPVELRKIEKLTYLAYRRMVAAALADASLGLAAGADGLLAREERYFKIISAFRSREYQAELRRQSPGSGRAGLAVNSPHFTGRALDIYVGGDPVSTSDINRALQVATPAYRWLARNAARFGFQPYFYEPWHWEYVGE